MDGSGISRYVSQDWLQERLRTYEILRRLRDDDELRGKWAETRIRVLKDKYGDSWKSSVTPEKVVGQFLDELDFLIRKNSDGRPSVHITPKKIGGLHYSEVLGIESRNLSSCLNRLVESAVQDIIRGTGKGAVLKGIFGEEFSKAFNEYVEKRLKEEFRRTDNAKP